jgi:hypothetical protein
MPRKTLQPPELFRSKPWGFSQVVMSPVTEPGSDRGMVFQGYTACGGWRAWLGRSIAP